MAINFESPVTLVGINGESPVAFHDKDDKLTLMYYTGGAVNARVVDKVATNWGELQFAPAEKLLIDQVSKMRVNYVSRDYTWVTWINRNISQRIAIIPNVYPAYDDSSPYRLYYALDSEKLYMNIAEEWEFIGSPNHDNLTNVGSLSHAELEQRLFALEQSGGSGGSGGGTGTVDLSNYYNKTSIDEKISALQEQIDNLPTGTNVDAETLRNEFQGKLNQVYTDISQFGFLPGTTIGLMDTPNTTKSSNIVTLGGSVIKLNRVAWLTEAFMYTKLPVTGNHKLVVYRIPQDLVTTSVTSLDKNLLELVYSQPLVGTATEGYYGYNNLKLAMNPNYSYIVGVESDSNVVELWYAADNIYTVAAYPYLVGSRPFRADAANPQNITSTTGAMTGYATRIKINY